MTLRFVGKSGCHHSLHLSSKVSTEISSLWVTQRCIQKIHKPTEKLCNSRQALWSWLQRNVEQIQTRSRGWTDSGWCHAVFCFSVWPPWCETDKQKSRCWPIFIFKSHFLRGKHLFLSMEFLYEIMPQILWGSQNTHGCLKENVSTCLCTLDTDAPCKRRTPVH